MNLLVILEAKVVLIIQEVRLFITDP